MRAGFAAAVGLSMLSSGFARAGEVHSPSPFSHDEAEWVWPVPAVAINSLYGRRRDPVHGSSRMHWGLDLEARYGAVVRAARKGRVIQAGWDRGHGRSVIIRHCPKPTETTCYTTRYSHLAQVIAFVGAKVEAGAVIGRVGNSGRSTGPHLHFEVHREGTPVDPLRVLAP